MISWNKIHRFQEKPGWCGPAVIQMILRACGIKKSQKEIAKDVYKPWWGTDQQLMFAYLSRFFGRIRSKENAVLSEVEKHLKKGHIVIVDWWDDLDADDPDGHYTLVIDYDKEAKKIKMADPSNARQGIWAMDSKEFNDRWYDTLDVHGKKWVDGWMLWIEPSSKL